MERSAWRRWTTPEEVRRRAAGRTKFNKVRQLRAALRRREVLRLLGELGWTYGSQARIAKELRVSAATISRDIAVLLPLVEECPTCGQFRLRAWWTDA